MKPSDAYKAGLCPLCLGQGWVFVFVPPPEHHEPCPGCAGVGTLEAMESHQEFLYAEAIRQHGPPNLDDG